ncbi:MAG: hypothetical protein LLF83_03410 [Methanobacterium sp.]|nr:hypothetical protein [Methanobacterium sp.]
MLISCIAIAGSSFATDSSQTTINGNTYTAAQIQDANDRVNTFQETNNRLPSYVTISGNKIAINDFLPYLENSSTTSEGTGNTGTTSTTSTTGTVINGVTYTNAQIQDAVTRVNTFKATNNRLPSYVTISGNKIAINDFQAYLGNSSTTSEGNTGTTSTTSTVINGVTYTNAQIQDAVTRVNTFKATNNRLPSYVTISGNKIAINDFLPYLGNDTATTITGTGTTSLGHGLLNGLSGTAGLSTLQSYIYKYLNHQYGASTTAAGVESTGLGDCWGLSAWTAQVLHDNGYTVRIVQGASVEASNHRWVQVLLGGTWVNFDPSLVTKKYWWGQSYSVTCASVNSIISTYT